jgi:hypothetical protein
MELTDVRVRNAMPKDKDYRLIDGHGLYPQVTTAGAKLWRRKYGFKGKQRSMSLGAYPEVSLSDARDALIRGRQMVATEIDAANEKKGATDTAATSTPSFHVVLNPFCEVEAKWFAKWQVGLDERYVRNTRSRLASDVLSRIGDRPIGEIQLKEIVEMARRVGGGGLKRWLAGCSK